MADELARYLDVVNAGLLRYEVDGTGLRDRVEALGGRIRMVSPAGSGTSLDVTIPLDSP